MDGNAATPNRRARSDHGHAGGDLPHDLYTFVIEDALNMQNPFWGCVAAGASFKTLGRKRTPQGKAVIAAHLDDLDAAEKRVNEIYFSWRSGRPTTLDDELNSMLDRWRTLTDTDELVLQWRTQRAANRRPSRNGRRQRLDT